MARWVGGMAKQPAKASNFSSFVTSVRPVAKLAPIMPSQRLLLALLASLAIHLALLGGGAWFSIRLQRPDRTPAPTPAMIDATLRVPPPEEAVLKDTLTETETPQPVRTLSALPSPPSPAGNPTAAKSTVAAQHKLAEHLYYPPDAIAAGLEGEVRLLLTLTAEGKVVDAQVARSSGHAILDQAAVRAAFAMGGLPGLDRTELILPVIFRLTP
jgi:protein TonB